MPVGFYLGWRAVRFQRVVLGQTQKRRQPNVERVIPAFGAAIRSREIFSPLTVLIDSLLGQAWALTATTALPRTCPFSNSAVGPDIYVWVRRHEEDLLSLASSRSAWEALSDIPYAPLRCNRAPHRRYPLPPALPPLVER